MLHKASSVLSHEYLLPKGQSAKVNGIDLEIRISLPGIFCVSLGVEHLASPLAIDNSDHMTPNNRSRWINAKISICSTKESISKNVSLKILARVYRPERRGNTEIAA